jgi:pilus assembly protein Flp/PilA
MQYSDLKFLCHFDQGKSYRVLLRTVTLQFIDISGGDNHAKSPSMRPLVLRFVNDQSAATAIEYGLIAAGIAVAIITVVVGLGT